MCQNREVVVASVVSGVAATLQPASFAPKEILYTSYVQEQM